MNPEFKGDYDTSGWCNFEAAVAGLFKPSTLLLNLVNFKDEMELRYQDHTHEELRSSG